MLLSFALFKVRSNIIVALYIVIKRFRNTVLFFRFVKAAVSDPQSAFFFCPKGFFLFYSKMRLNASYSNMRFSPDRAFQPRNFSSANETTARCKHCSKLIPLESMEEHEMFFCPLKPIRCQHYKANGEMCNFLCSGADALRNHYKTCKDHPRKRRSVSIRESGSLHGVSARCMDLCDDCQQVFPDRASLTEHQQVCPLKSVPCPLRCGLWMQRGQVPDHILQTAIKHKPLRRPSADDYGGDNIHMVVAVLMEALQQAKKAQQQSQALYEGTLSNVEPSTSFTSASPRHSVASVEREEGAKAIAAPPANLTEQPVAAGASKLLNSSYLRAAASAESAELPADVLISASAASFSDASSKEKMEKAEESNGNVTPLLNGVARSEKSADVQAPLPVEHRTAAAAAATKGRKRRPVAVAKGRRSSTARLTAAAPSSIRASFRTTPAVTTCPPSKLRYEDFIRKSPTQCVRLRPTYCRWSVSPRVHSLASPGEVSSTTISPRVSRTYTA